MRKSFIFLFPVLLFYSCSNRDSQNEKQSRAFHSDSLHFHIQLPPGWEAREQGHKAGILEPLTDSADHFRENMVVWTEEMPVAIPDTEYTKLTCTELKIKNPETLIEQLPPLCTPDRCFGHFRFQFPLQPGIPCFVEGYTAVLGNRGYNFSCSFIDSTKNYPALFENLMHQVKLEP